MGIYVGIKPRTAKREVFESARTPTQSSHGKRYSSVIGPFRTVSGAEVMARYGRNNPHLQQVSDAEKMATKMRKEGWRRSGKWDAKRRD